MDFAPILKFLKDLAKHNDREWFEKNKPKYLKAKADFDSFVANMLESLITFDSSLAALNPKKLSFRIYRDVRFSKDKKPYKNNFGAGFSANGKMAQEPGYYLQIQPGNSFIAGGFYLPEAESLAKIRQEIDYNPEVLKKILNDKKFKATFGDFDQSDKLKTAPKGYPKDHQYLEWIKLKSFVVIHHFTDKEVLDKKFLNHVSSVCKTLMPLNTFLKEACS